MSKEPEYFVEMERLSEESTLRLKWQRHRKWLASSSLTHVVVLLLLIVGPMAHWIGDGSFVPGDVVVRFYEVGGEGQGGGGGGGGSGGERISAFIPRRDIPEPEVEEPEPRQAPVAPRKPRQLNFDDLDVPDLPEQSQELFDAGVFSPDETEFPGLSLTDSRDLGGIDTTPSAGTGGGIGGGEGSGVGTGEGWGVGPGWGGGFGGGAYSPGAWDIEPVLVYKPPDPEYPPAAKKRLVSGEVMLQVLVKRDGSTEVVSVIKSLPYGCVEAAKENAQKWRWKPALKEGKPVDAIGMITVDFDIFSR